MNKNIGLKVVSAFMLHGEIADVNAIVEVTHAEAKYLIQRGVAELHAEPDAEPGDKDENLDKPNKNTKASK